MTPLRQRMIEDMQLRNLAPETQRNYVHHIRNLARFYLTSPDLLGMRVCISLPTCTPASSAKHSRYVARHGDSTHRR